MLYTVIVSGRLRLSVSAPDEDEAAERAETMAEDYGLEEPEVVMVYTHGEDD